MNSWNSVCMQGELQQAPSAYIIGPSIGSTVLAGGDFYCNHRGLCCVFYTVVNNNSHCRVRGKARKNMSILYM